MTAKKKPLTQAHGEAAKARSGNINGLGSFPFFRALTSPVILDILKRELGVTITVRSKNLILSAPDDAAIQRTKALVGALDKNVDSVEHLRDLVEAQIPAHKKPSADFTFRSQAKSVLTARGPEQTEFAKHIKSHDISIGLGPAGTGKTYVACAAAATALMNGDVEKIYLFSPSVAMEDIGYLPGDKNDKIGPYVQQMIESLEDLVGKETVVGWISGGKLETDVIGFVRGRSIKKAFILLDEAQNTTPSQLKTFMSRIGEGSKMVLTGDPRQIDLRGGENSSGLVAFMNGLKKQSPEIQAVYGVTDFINAPILRHASIPVTLAIFENKDVASDLVQAALPVAARKPQPPAPAP